MSTHQPVDDAVTQVAAAIDTYGEPRWLANVPSRVRRLVPVEIKESLAARARISDGWSRQGTQLVFGRADHATVLRQWAGANVYAVMTVREIADSAGVPQAAVRKMAEERPDIFRKSEGRNYEVRDPHTDRKADKQ